MSQVRFTVTCFPQKGGAPVVTQAREWIEPLVAFLRHPLTMCAAMYPESVSDALGFGTRLWRLPRDAVETVQNMIEVRSVCGGGNQQPHCLIQNKDFLLLRGASIANTVMTAGTAGQNLADGVPVPQLGHRTRRSILFDLGCSMFHVDSDHDEVGLPATWGDQRQLSALRVVGLDSGYDQGVGEPGLASDTVQEPWRHVHQRVGIRIHGGEPPRLVGRRACGHVFYYYVLQRRRVRGARQQVQPVEFAARSRGA